jgi:acyl-CoA thioesterase-1
MRSIKQQANKHGEASSIISAILASFCFGAVLLLCGCVDFNVRNINSPGKNIICFGNSLTSGYGTDKESSYPAVLAHLTSFNVINAGLAGETTKGALQRLGTDVLDKNPVLVIIELGGNDLLEKVPLPETINNLRRIIEEIQKKGVMAALVDISSSILFEEYRDAYRNLAKEKGAIFISQAVDGIITEPALKSDYLHPNNHGYRIMAHRIYRAVMPYLNRNIMARGIAEGD